MRHSEVRVGMFLIRTGPWLSDMVQIVDKNLEVDTITVRFIHSDMPNMAGKTFDVSPRHCKEYEGV